MDKDLGASASGPGCEASPSAADGVFAESHPSRGAACSFCETEGSASYRLIAGRDGAYICDECVLIAVDVVKEEHRLAGRGVACPGCGAPISMTAAVGRDQRWGMSLTPGPSGLLQAATIAGAIDGAQKLMRFSCREDGANAQTYIESIRTDDDGSLHIKFATLPTSKKWTEANGRRDTDRSGEADETAQQAQPEARAGAEGIAQPPQES